ncbi:uncharacterized protein LOC110043963 isoform X2 [Orbicella faveolata]|uniref:uncharacterized protein LOC110043963 isoform X2 n=1 Tax=Orbicella faveolata TaxID=48498 RepID=UPI0009E1C12F|nr:uncharacterized protein LOC110043963 isoform X2 [Orbicella faveolata]
MKTILALLFVAAVAAYTQAQELEYHPQAIMHYLEMEDREMKICIGLAVICHKTAKDDACRHLKCIELTSKCFAKAGLTIEDLPENMKKCLPIIPCCLVGSGSCEEKLCCFMRYGECLKELGDKEE